MIFEAASALGVNELAKKLGPKGPGAAPTMPGPGRSFDDIYGEVKGARQPRAKAPGPDLTQLRQKMFSGKAAAVERNAKGEQQMADDAITRRMTALGQAGSGAAIGAQLKARESVQNSANIARNDLASREAEAELGGAIADRDFNFKQEAFDEELANSDRAFALQRASFEDDQANTAFNRRMAELGLAPKAKPGVLGTLAGTGAGALLGGPAGASLGANVGSALDNK